MVQAGMSRSACLSRQDDASGPALLQGHAAHNPKADLMEPEMSRPRILAYWAMALFFVVMCILAIAFWIAALLGGGARPLMADLGPGPVSIFVVAHMPATAAGILLWRRYLPHLPFWPRLFLQAGTIYFSVACVMAFAGNYLLASIYGRFAPPG